jgi:hypothetical protein
MCARGVGEMVIGTHELLELTHVSGSEAYANSRDAEQ